MKAYLSEGAAVLNELDASVDGLTDQEAVKRLERYGKNELLRGKKISLAGRLLHQLADPMILILIAAAIVSGVTAVYAGESLADVIIILLVVLINAVLGVAQESKAEKSIEALQDMTAAVSKVLRNGQQVMLRSELLVPGDVILLEAGDAVPADARILECISIKVEEAALTGESVAVSKKAEALQEEETRDIPLADRKNMLYMGSTLVYGRGSAVITATGMQTEMGKIADSLTKTVEDQTPLQKKLTQLSRVLSVLVLGICAFVFVWNLLRMYPDLTGTGILDTFMTAVSLAVAAIPEGLAAVVTIVLSMGVTSLSGKRAVIRKLTAVETLGCTQIICSDKTGTLTQNKMTVSECRAKEETLLVRAMALCSDARLDQNQEAVGEPTECALVNDCLRCGMSKTDLEQVYVRVGEVPFDSVRKMMTTVHQQKDGGLIQFTKGAPDEVLKRCTSFWDGEREIPMTDSLREEIAKENKEMADRALRVLCASMRIWEAQPERMDADELEQKLCYVGLTGMIDPVRPEVRSAIDECRAAGIRPIMITGDHRDTAAAIAMELGIIHSRDQAITGVELDTMDDEAFAQVVEQYSVYARVQPEHKVRIVKAWKEKGRITAMTGDGVNDAPSIKCADIGIGMGITGTDVTKNVADMVLADDNFATIVAAVREGRRIYDNIRRAVQFLLASNLAEVLAIFTATLFGFTILEPVHLLWINLVTDCFPALALGMEEAEEDIMKRPPRDSGKSIFADGLGIQMILQGLLVTVITLAAYFTGHYLETGRWEITESTHGTTMAFLTLSLAEIFHSFNMRSLDRSIFRSRKQNPFLLGAALLSLLFTIVVIYVPVLAKAFSFAVLSPAEWICALLLAAAVIPVVELTKLLRRKGSRRA